MKKLLISLGILIGLLILAGIAIVLVVDAQKSRIESAVSDALGIEFRIQGKAGRHRAERDRHLPGPEGGRKNGDLGIGNSA